MRRRLTAAMALALALLAGACAEKVPQPSPLPSYPKMPSGSPTPTPASPTPSSAKHQDLLSVQSAYRRAFAEEQRLLAIKDGKPPDASKVLVATTSGAYRDLVLGSVRSTRQMGEHMTKPGQVRGVAMEEWTETRVTFLGCEDFSHARWVRADGTVDNTRDPKVLRSVQRLTAVKDAGKWRIDDLETQRGVDFVSAPCNGEWYR